MGAETWAQVVREKPDPCYVGPYRATHGRTRSGLENATTGFCGCSAYEAVLRRNAPTEGGASMAGELVHFELPADDTRRATKFWSSLFGWNLQKQDGPFEYHMFQGEPGGAIYPSQAGERGPIVYFGTE